MKVTAADLVAFVEETDRLGGPSSAPSTTLWRDFKYFPRVSVDVSLDPDGIEYFDQMMALYEEIAGRRIDQSVTEQTLLDVDRLAPLESPYADVPPADRAVHYLRLSKALHAANLPKGGRVLDMGCGWGLSSEFLAQLGFDVDAVDINPLFIELVGRRAARLNLKIRPQCVSFDAYESELAVFDAVLFYECFHHAVRPSHLLARIRKFMKPDAKLILVGEPIQHVYWPQWGLRLDPLSVYCIRKFGWFESGWSESYLRRIVARNGMTPHVYQSDDPAIGAYLIACTKYDLDAAALAMLADPSAWWLEGDHLVSGRSGSRSALSVVVPPDAVALHLEIYLFRRKPLDVVLRDGLCSRQITLQSGRNDVRVEVDSGQSEIRYEFSFAPWCPDEVLHNGDRRRLGFHLKSLSVEHR
jgi:2-polyprenyl-3-methyl-5-hydroxy-6-metoxy-1,4-benzoquinol methylase